MEMRTHLNIPCKNGCKSDGSIRGAGLDLLCDEPRATDSDGCRTVSALSMDMPAYVATTIYFRKAEREREKESGQKRVNRPPAHTLVTSSLSNHMFHFSSLHWPVLKWYTHVRTGKVHYQKWEHVKPLFFCKLIS